MTRPTRVHSPGLMVTIVKRTVISGMMMLVFSSSLAYALVRRHVAWDGMVTGKGGSKIRGVIAMEGGKAVGTTSAVVKYAGDVGGVTRAWHVHVGSCAKGGAVLGAATAYAPLRVNAKGAAEGVAILRLALPDSGEYYVNIHESASNMGKIIACGDLLLAE